MGMSEAFFYLPVWALSQSHIYSLQSPLHELQADLFPANLKINC